MNHLVVCLLLFVIGLAVPASAEIEVQTDRFSCNTTVSTKTRVPERRPGIALIGVYEADGRPQVAITVQRSAES